MSLQFFTKLGFRKSDLQPSSTPEVNQAGGGATLKVLGLMPSNHTNSYFLFQGINHKFPLSDIYVVDGLGQDFNISLTFLKKHDFILHIKSDHLIFAPDGKPEVKIPMIPNTANNIFCASISPKVPQQGLHVLPLQTVSVPTNPIPDHGFFAPRIPSASSTSASFRTEPKGAFEEVWQVQPPHGGDTVLVTNLSPSVKTLYPNTKMGSICAVQLPSGDIADIGIPDIDSKRAKIRSHIRVEKEFEKLFLQKIEDLLLQFTDAISWNGEPGFTTLVQTDIKTGHATPVFCPPRKMSPDVAAIVRVQILKWLRDGVIIRVDNASTRWNARLLVVPKKLIEGCDREYRICADMRHLNRVSLVDKAPFSPLPMLETFHMLGQAKIFSVLDLSQAFAAIPINPKHRYKTAFQFEGQVFYFRTTCFGLASAPGSLGRLLGLALASVPKSIVTWYMDDLIVFSKNPHDHLRHLGIVFQALLNAGLKLRLDKCHFFRTAVEFLGHLISIKGYSIIPSYISAIMDWPLVTSKYSVQSFLGSAGYYASFIDDYATKAKPLINVLSRPGPDEAEIDFSEKEKKELLKSMNSLKLALTTAPTLAFADFGPKAAKFVLDADFSNKHGTIGCVLSQVQPPGSGCERVILYKAKSLRPSQQAYPPYKGIHYCNLIQPRY